MLSGRRQKTTCTCQGLAGVLGAPGGRGTSVVAGACVDGTGTIGTKRLGDVTGTVGPCTGGPAGAPGDMLIPPGVTIGGGPCAAAAPGTFGVRPGSVGIGVTGGSSSPGAPIVGGSTVGTGE